MKPQSILTTVILMFLQISAWAAAGWQSFSSLGTNSSQIYANITGISSTLYLTEYAPSGPGGSIWRYTSGGGWVKLDDLNLSGNGSLDALSAVEVNGTTRVFIGGDFDITLDNNVDTTEGIVAYTPSNSSGSRFSYLGSSGNHGVSGYVKSVRALFWKDDVSGTVYQRAMVYVGGSFTSAGSVSTTSIARWSGFGSTGVGWESIGGVDTYTGGPATPLVNDIAIITGSSGNNTTLASLVAVGTFRKQANSIFNYNIAKYTGSWATVGQGSWLSSYDEEDNCEMIFTQYTPGNHIEAVAIKGSDYYFGGYFNTLIDVNDTVYFDSIPTEDVCEEYNQAFNFGKIGSNGVQSFANNIYQITRLVYYRGNIYAAGGFDDGMGGTIPFAKLDTSTGSWAPIAMPSGANNPIDFYANSNDLFVLTTDAVYRYRDF